MNPTFQRLMSQATRLTRAGNLKDAMAAIQAALGRGKSLPTNGDACVIDAIDAIDVEAREVGREAVAPERSAAPERAAAPDGQFIAGSHTERAGTREYKLFVPPQTDRQATALVVMLHGCTQDPDDFAAGTRMNEAALERGMFVLYPAQAQSANPSRCWNWFKHNHQRRDRGEPAILAGMTRAVIKRYNIDPRRVYVAGLSAGGAMAAILGEAYPDVFAAVGVHSGLPAGSATDVASAFSAMKGGAAASLPTTAGRPTIVFHGDQDSTVHPVNGERVAAASPGAAAPQVERVHGDDGRAYTQHTYRDAQGSVVAEHWVVHGTGHAWSGGSTRGSYTDAKGPDATHEMLRFFAANVLPAAH